METDSSRFAASDLEKPAAENIASPRIVLSVLESPKVVLKNSERFAVSF